MKFLLPFIISFEKIIKAVWGPKKTIFAGFYG